MSAYTSCWRVACLLLALACTDRTATPNKAEVRSASGDPRRGHALVAEFQCNRCHDGTGTEEAARDKNCTRCHRAIADGEFEADEATLARWRGRIRHFLDLPSLEGVDQRLRRDWLARFLVSPSDLRPNLDESMPRLPLSPAQAQDIAAYLVPHEAPAVSHSDGDMARGRRLLEDKGCAACHRYSGVPALRAVAIPVQMSAERFARALRLAPDLRFTRDRLSPDFLVRWLEAPSRARKDALMPDIPLSAPEIRDIATYLRRAPLATVDRAAPVRLPPLNRPVRWEEVEQRVFRDTCWHCHSDPDYAIGDGGPGNTGGFGFAGRGINLADYEGVLAGYVDGRGERQSLFELAEGRDLPLLLQSLLARRAEEGGRALPDVRGMPLGLPSLTPEEIQLVETWIFQGRPH